MTGLDPIYIESVVKSALAEDIGSGDITTLLTVPENTQAKAVISSKAKGIIAGMDIARSVFAIVDPDIRIEEAVSDGTKVSVGDTIMVITGKARSILTGERVALNFLQRMSGVATVTSRYVDLVSHTNARIVDTRKTTPGLRRLEKYSVIVGGGRNHRFGLSDGILIKDNHIAASGGISAAIKSAQKRAPHTLKIEIEVTSLEQLEEAIRARADVVLLDNMSLSDMSTAVKIADGRVTLEASGGVNEKSVKLIAETGVDIISVGALTHSATALDISLNIK